MERLIEKAAILMEALPYIQAFRDCVVLIKFGGSAMENPDRQRSILRDIVFMECAGMRPVIVHGGGKAISAGLKKAGISSHFVQGARYTDKDAIRIVDRVLHEEVNTRIVEILEDLRGNPCPVKGKNVLRTEPYTPPDAHSGAPLDLGYVGQVVNVDTEQLWWILNRRQIPVITPVGRDMNGDIYNINADMAACRIASALKAEKLVFLSDVPGILEESEDDNSLLSTIKLTDIEPLIRNDIIREGMIPKIRSAAQAMRENTSKVHLIDGRIQHALLLEIFTREGVGTQIVPDS